MADEQSSPAAGWYPDPEDAAGERWWNGVGWSDSKRPATGRAAADAGRTVDAAAEADEDRLPAGYVRPDPFAAGRNAEFQQGWRQGPGPYAAAPAQWPGTPAQPYGAPAQPYGTPAQPYGAPAQPYGAPAHPYGAPAQPYGLPPYGYQPVARPMQNIPALVGMILAIAGVALNVFVLFGALGLAGGIVSIVGLQRARRLTAEGVVTGNGRGFAIAGIVVGFGGAALTWLFFGVMLIGDLTSPYS